MQPLNDDPNALPVEQYNELVLQMQYNAEADGTGACRVAVPAAEVEAALARLDSADG